MNLSFADSLLYALMKRRCPGGVAPLAELKLEDLQRVLLVLTTGLGDAVLSTPVFAALRPALASAQIRLFCRSSWLPLFTADPNLDGVIAYFGKYRRLSATLAALREFDPELALVLHGNDPDILPLCHLAGSRYIVRVPTRGTRYAFLLSNRSRAEDCDTVPGLHYVDNRLRVLDSLGIAPVSRTPAIHLEAAAAARTQARLRSTAGEGPYWVLHAYAADAYKVWPLQKARELLGCARRVHPDHAVVLTGSNAERRNLDALASGIEKVHVVAGEYDMAETAAVLADARCVVAPDTGILHLAAALDRPVVGLYAATSASMVGPRAATAVPLVIQKPQTCIPCVEKKCPYTPENCMSQIGVGEVLQALAQQLAVS
jgi:ADP-heptose:LPS heptosyltransferase